ncbi:MAG TPA: poly-gamma-glutamate system protein [Actinomycetota bacterium]|nr:poly-gamma-glutamate system protein [Actinomycetota bacterium]
MQGLSARQDGYRPLAFLLAGLVSLGTYAAVTRTSDGSVSPTQMAARRAAMDRVEAGQAAVRAERRQLGLPVTRGDRLRTGLIGLESSDITTEVGSLRSKRTSTDPRFAAAVVDMLSRAGVRPGDVVAIGMSASFPALNLDTVVAAEVLHAQPVIVSSVGSSQWGANEPRLTWLAMERALADAGVIHHRSGAVDAGGPEVGAGRADPAAKLRESVAKSVGVPVIPALTLDDEVAYRVAFYDRVAARLGAPIRTFVNVGGAAADVGPGGAGEELIAPGLSRPRLGPFETAKSGVLGAMAARGIPVVNLVDVSTLADRYDIPWDPAERPEHPEPPGPPPSPLAAGIALVALALAVVAAHRAGFFRVPAWDLPPELRHRPGRAPAGAL